jgi:hypothetical protein
MFKKISSFVVFVLFLNACTTAVTPQAKVRGELSSVFEFCGEGLGIKCQNGTYEPEDSLVIHRDKNKDGLVLEYDEKIDKSAGGKVCDFVVEGKKIKSYSNCTEQ